MRPQAPKTPGGAKTGVDDGARTHDRRNHNPELYQLSYVHHKKAWPWAVPVPGAPGRTRTFNPRLRRPMLYPVELRAQTKVRDPAWATQTKLVGVERFELPTSCSQSRRATRLRYTPSGPKGIRGFETYRPQCRVAKQPRLRQGKPEGRSVPLPPTRTHDTHGRK